MSHGTEGRRGNPAEDIAASSSVYEYIVFRGSDVKDINFADEQKDNQQPEPPQVPDDPAILGVSNNPVSLLLQLLPFVANKTTTHCMMNFITDVNYRPDLNAHFHVDISVAFLLMRSIALVSMYLSHYCLSHFVR